MLKLCVFFFFIYSLYIAYLSRIRVCERAILDVILIFGLPGSCEYWIFRVAFADAFKFGYGLSIELDCGSSSCELCLSFNDYYYLLI